MSSHPGATRRRRNTIGPRDAVFVRVGAAAAATAASLTSCTPTGQPAADAVWCAALAATVAWASATAPWWALLAAAGRCRSGRVIGSPRPARPSPDLATAAAAVVAERRASAPVVRCIVGGVVANVVMRSEWTSVRVASAVLAGAVMGAARRDGVVASRQDRSPTSGPGRRSAGRAVRRVAGRAARRRMGQPGRRRRPVTSHCATVWQVSGAERPDRPRNACTRRRHASATPRRPSTPGGQRRRASCRCSPRSAKPSPT